MTRHLHWQVSAAATVAVVAAVIWNVFVKGGTHTDVSWLLTVGEKMLAGERLYVDIWETNPPFSAFLYLPMVWLGVVTPFSAELWTKLATLVWVAAFGLSAMVLGERLGLLRRQERLVLVPVGLYLLLLFMPATFSQREHFGVASALPMIVLAAWRMSPGGRPSPHWAWFVAAGLGASFTMMVKPHYALAFLFPYLFAAWTRRSIRLLFCPEVLVAATAVLCYAAVLWSRYPEYLSQIVPLLLDVYLYSRPLAELILVLNLPQLVLGILLVVLVATVARPGRYPLVWSNALAALGFYLAYLAMGKGWKYHAMPAMTLTILAISLVGSRLAAGLEEKAGRDSGGSANLVFILAATIAILQTVLTWGRFETSTVPVERLRTILPAPVVGAVSANIGMGHPMTRMLNGRWIERTCADWIVGWGRLVLQEDPDMGEERRGRIEARIQRAISHKVEVWSGTAPDIVLLEPQLTIAGTLLRSDPRFAEILGGYTTVYESGRMRVALRNDHLPAWKAAEATASSPGAASD